MGFFRYPTERGRVHVIRQKPQKKNSNGNGIQQTTYYNMRKSDRATTMKQVEELRQVLGERDAEVRDLAYKDLLPDQMLRAQHAL